MIPQAILDWLRDAIVTFLAIVNLPIELMGGDAAAAGLGSIIGIAGAVLALFVSPGLWGPVLIAWGTYLSLWGITGLIAVITRRGTAS